MIFKDNLLDFIKLIILLYLLEILKGNLIFICSLMNIFFIIICYDYMKIRTNNKR